LTEKWNHYLSALAHARKHRDSQRAISAKWFLLAIFLFLGLWVGIGFEIAMLSLLSMGLIILNLSKQRMTNIQKNYETTSVNVERQLLNKIAQDVAPWLNYRHNLSPKMTEVTNSKLINGRIEFVNGTLGLYGEWEGRGSITATQIEAGHYEPLRKSDGTIHNYTKIIYQGLFISMSFPRVKKGWVMLKSDNLEALEWLSNDWRSALTKNYIRMDNPEFERHFNVLASNQQEGFEILSSHIMEALVNFVKKQFKFPLILTFRDEKCTPLYQRATVHLNCETMKHYGKLKFAVLK
jgi:hypothetical protein